MNAVDTALRLDPQLIAALTLRGRLAMALNRYDLAKDSLELMYRAWMQMRFRFLNREDDLLSTGARLGCVAHQT